MKFAGNVKIQFEKAGWFPNRHIKKENSQIKDFEKLPKFLKDFLNEYGNLSIETFNPNDETSNFTGTFDLTRYNQGHITISEFFKEKSWFGHDLYLFFIGHYVEENARIFCDEKDNVYAGGDYPGHISDDFQTGIEKVILEDPNDLFYWDEQNSQWSEIPN